MYYLTDIGRITVCNYDVSDFRTFERQGTWPGEALRPFETTDSTTIQAKIWLMSDAPHGAIVFADHQESGRGRFDRNWHSQTGRNLLFTIILTQLPSLDVQPLVSLATSIAVASGIERATGLSPRIKWPNDVLIGGAKTCGILVERCVAGKEREGLLVGIGINVNQTVFPDGMNTPPTSLSLESGRPVERAAVYHAVLDAFSTIYSNLLTSPNEVLRLYQSRLMGLGSEIALQLTQNGQRVEGTMVGIADDGGLVLETEGRQQVFHAGDVTTRSDI